MWSLVSPVLCPYPHGCLWRSPASGSAVQRCTGKGSPLVLQLLRDTLAAGGTVTGDKPCNRSRWL